MTGQAKGRIFMAITMLAIGLIIASHIAGGGSSSGGSITPARSTTAHVESRSPQTTTSTEAPTTTTTSVSASLDTAIDMHVTKVRADDSYTQRYELKLAWTVTNLTGIPITAYQTVFVVSAVDRLGRSFSMRLASDCTKPPLAAKANRTGSLGPGAEGPLDTSEAEIARLNAEAAGLDNCTVGVWHINRFESDEMGLWNALRDGAPATIVIEKHRVSFSDGTGIGTTT